MSATTTRTRAARAFEVTDAIVAAANRAAYMLQTRGASLEAQWKKGIEEAFRVAANQEIPDTAIPIGQADTLEALSAMRQVLLKLGADAWWDCDGIEMQEALEEAGLIVLVKAETDDPDGDFVAGDDILKLTALGRLALWSEVPLSATEAKIYD